MEPRTTITYKGETYPFYKTNRGNVDFENAGFTMNQVIDGQSQATLALVYFHMRDCAKRAQKPIEDSFEQFIDASEADITNVFMRLAEIRESTEKQILIDLVNHYIKDFGKKNSITVQLSMDCSDIMLVLENLKKRQERGNQQAPTKGQKK